MPNKCNCDFLNWNCPIHSCTLTLNLMEKLYSIPQHSHAWCARGYLWLSWSFEEYCISTNYCQTFSTRQHKQSKDLWIWMPTLLSWRFHCLKKYLQHRGISVSNKCREELLDLSIKAHELRIETLDDNQKKQPTDVYNSKLLTKDGTTSWALLT